MPHTSLPPLMTHELPSQQPLGHVVASQLAVAGTHERPLQRSVPSHTSHAAPPVPHALDAVPTWQTPSLQQPVGQVVALQVEGGSQRAPVHCSAPLQTSQVRPPVPQAPVLAPPTHTPALQQPSGHVDGLQAPPLHSPALQV